jgi:hypothetical protein
MSLPGRPGVGLTTLACVGSGVGRFFRDSIVGKNTHRPTLNPPTHLSLTSSLPSISLAPSFEVNTRDALEIFQRPLPIARPSPMDAPPADSRECQFCSAWFSRVDAARRHAKRCQKREGRILLDRKRGRPARSCDQCSRVKVHCKANDEGPCERCIPRGLSCTLDLHCTDLIGRDPSPAVEGQGGQRDDRMALSSLLNLTDDHQDYLTEQTIGMEPDGVPLGPIFLPLTDAGALSSDVMDCLDPSILLLFDYEPSTTPVTLDGQYPNHGEHHHNDLTCTKSWESAISARLGLLEVKLSKHAASSYKHSLSFDPQSYQSFFNVSNVHRFIATFCRKRHYRYPIIHWPTFEVEKVPLALLLVVALTGAAYSLGRDDCATFAVRAREFYKLADAYVFQMLQNHMSDLQVDSLGSIELCQAALLMYALDLLPTGDLEMQHTAVAMRLPMLVSALRRLDFVNVRHESSEDWQTFIRHEQMIRIAAWTFCADCLATLTCNKTPSFSIMEMRGDLPCDPNKWEADAASLLDFWSCSRRSVSFNLKDLMSHWLNNDLLTSMDTSRLPVFCLHIMLCGTSILRHLFNVPFSDLSTSTAFQQVVFNSHIAMSLALQSERLLQALDTWRCCWDDTIENLPETDRLWLGVARHVSDLEQLTRRIVEVAVADSPASFSSRYLQRIPSFRMREIHEFMRDFVVVKE